MRRLLLLATLVSGTALAGSTDRLSSELDGRLCLHDCALVGSVEATAHPVSEGLEGTLSVDDHMAFALSLVHTGPTEARLRLDGEGARAEAQCTVTDSVRLDCAGDLVAPDGDLLPFTLELAPAADGALPTLAEHR